MNCQTAREEVAVALMTRAPVDGDVLDHLSRCDDCAAEAGQMQEVVDLLADLELSDAQPAGADDLFLERLLREAGRRRSAWRHRAGLLLAGVAGAALVALGTAVAITQPFGGAGGTTASVTQGAVTASVVVEEEAGASDLVVSVTGVERGTHCVLRVSTADGQDEVVADWVALYEGTSHVEAAADAPPEALTSVELVDATDDRVLVTVPLT